MRKQRVVVLGGAGAMGRIIVRDLVRFGRREAEVLVADRDISAARNLPVDATPVDVTDARSLERTLEGAAIVIASLPYRFNLAAMHGALAARAHFIDLGGLFHVTGRQLALDRAFKTVARTAILGVGSSPGITNILAVYAAEGLDRVREVHTMVGASDRTRFKRHPAMGFGYSPETLIDEFALEAAVFRAGKMRMVPPLDPAERRIERFPAPVGRLALDATLHSEVATLPRYFADRGVREVTFRQGFDAGFADRLALLIRMGLASTEALPRTGAVPRDVLLELLARQPKPEPAGPIDRYEILRATVRGERARRPVLTVADCHAGPKAGNGTGPDIDTGAPPSIAALMLLRGEIDARPGVFAPEDLIPPRPFFRELALRGMVVRRRRREAVQAAK